MCAYLSFNTKKEEERRTSLFAVIIQWKKRKKSHHKTGNSSTKKHNNYSKRCSLSLLHFIVNILAFNYLSHGSEFIGVKLCSNNNNNKTTASFGNTKFIKILVREAEEIYHKLLADKLMHPFAKIFLEKIISNPGTFLWSDLFLSSFFLWISLNYSFVKIHSEKMSIKCAKAT